MLVICRHTRFNSSLTLQMVRRSVSAAFWESAIPNHEPTVQAEHTAPRHAQTTATHVGGLPYALRRQVRVGIPRARTRDQPGWFGTHWTGYAWTSAAVQVSAGIFFTAQDSKASLLSPAGFYRGCSHHYPLFRLCCMSTVFCLWFALNKIASHLQLTQQDAHWLCFREKKKKRQKTKRKVVLVASHQVFSFWHILHIYTFAHLVARAVYEIAQPVLEKLLRTAEVREHEMREILKRNFDATEDLWEIWQNIPNAPRKVGHIT